MEICCTGRKLNSLNLITRTTSEIKTVRLIPIEVNSYNADNEEKAILKFEWL